MAHGAEKRAVIKQLDRAFVLAIEQVLAYAFAQLLPDLLQASETAADQRDSMLVRATTRVYLLLVQEVCHAVLQAGELHRRLVRVEHQRALHKRVR